MSPRSPRVLQKRQRGCGRWSEGSVVEGERSGRGGGGGG